MSDIWNLTSFPAAERPDLLAAPVKAALSAWPGPTPVAEVEVAEIDPDLSDTAAFCERYASPLEASANCVVVAGKRGGEVRYAACVILATTRADVNGVIRKRLDVRKASFAPQADAAELTGMEYGGITPLGVPDGWPILVDAAVAATPRVVIGSGLRASKLALPGAALGELPGAEIIEDLAKPA